MKELGKYVLLMALMIMMASLLLVDAFGQIKIEKINSNFTGEKVRFEFDFSQPPQYYIMEDWEDNTIGIILPNTFIAESEKKALGAIRNYIVEHAEFTNTEDGLTLQIATARDFKVKHFTGNNKRKLYVDVSFEIDQPDVKTLLSRGEAYEERNEYVKAAKQYQEALSIESGDNDILKKLVLAAGSVNSAGESSSLSKNIERDGKENHQEIPQENIDSSQLTSSQTLSLENKSVQKEQFAGEQDDAKNTNSLIPANNFSGQDNGTNQPADVSLNNLENNSGSATPESLENKETTQNNSNPNGVAGDVRGSRVIPGNEDMVIGFQDLLRKSGTEMYVLIGLYSIAGILAFIIYKLVRKLVILQKVSKKREKLKKPLSMYKPPVNSKLLAKKTKMVSEKQIRDVRQFARKLSALYSKTDQINQKKQIQADRHNNIPVTEEHTHKIEAAFPPEADQTLADNEHERLQYDSESISLTKKFRENNGSRNSSSDKYEAVRQLGQQNWEVWEIARELSMGTEEVKMALGQDMNAGNAKSDRQLYRQIYQMADAKLSPSEISTRLQIGEEEVLLALKLRRKHGAEVI